MNIHENVLHKCQMIYADWNIYSILQRKIISMEEKKHLSKRKCRMKHTRKSWNSSYTGGLGASWIKKEENLNKWEIMLWRKKRKCINYVYNNMQIRNRMTFSQVRKSKAELQLTDQHYELWHLPTGSVSWPEGWPRNLLLSCHVDRQNNN